MRDIFYIFSILPWCFGKETIQTLSENEACEWSSDSSGTSLWALALDQHQSCPDWLNAQKEIGAGRLVVSRQSAQADTKQKIAWSICWRSGDSDVTEGVIRKSFLPVNNFAATSIFASEQATQYSFMFHCPIAHSHWFAKGWVPVQVPYAWKGRNKGHGFGTHYSVILRCSCVPSFTFHTLHKIGLFHLTCGQFCGHSRYTLWKRLGLLRDFNEKSAVCLLGQDRARMHSSFLFCRQRTDSV